MIKQIKSANKKFYTQIHRTIPESFDQFREMISADLLRGRNMLMGELLPMNESNTFYRLSRAAYLIGDTRQSWCLSKTMDVILDVYRKALACQKSYNSQLFMADREDVFWLDVKDGLHDGLVNADIFRDYEQCNDFLQALYDC